MMAREYTPEWYLERIAWMKAAQAADFAVDRHHCRVSRRDRGRFHSDHEPAGRGGVRLRVRVQVLGAAQYACAGDDRLGPEEEKATRLQVLLDRQREIQRVNYSKHIGEVIEVMVEGRESGARADFRPQQPEQAGEFYVARSR